MTIVFDRNIPAAELLLRILLKREDLQVLEVTAQREYKSPVPKGRIITLDIHAEDTELPLEVVEELASLQPA